MNADFLGLLLLYLAILLCAAPLLGRHIRQAINGERTWLTAWGQPLERGLYRLAGVDPAAEMDWRRYAVAMLVFNVLGVLAVYALQRLQGWCRSIPPGCRASRPTRRSIRPSAS